MQVLNYNKFTFILQPWAVQPDFVPQQTFLNALPSLFSFVAGTERTLTQADTQYMWQIIKQRVLAPGDGDRITLEQFYKV